MLCRLISTFEDHMELAKFTQRCSRTRWTTSGSSPIWLLRSNHLPRHNWCLNLMSQPEHTFKLFEIFCCLCELQTPKILFIHLEFSQFTGTDESPSNWSFAVEAIGITSQSSWEEEFKWFYQGCWTLVDFLVFLLLLSNSFYWDFQLLYISISRTASGI